MEELPIITGTIFLYHAFDIGEEIDLSRVEREQRAVSIPTPLEKYFKNYHTPLSVVIPQPPRTPEVQMRAQHCSYDTAKLHNFGVITLRYQLPFACSFDDLRARLISFDEQSTEQSLQDAYTLYQAIEPTVKHAQFHHIHSSYALIQIDELPESQSSELVKQRYGSAIASLLRFETETLSAHEQADILDHAIHYYSKDLIIIDTQASLICDPEYAEILDLFEFMNVQHLELQYFDRLLDKQLNTVYNQERAVTSWLAYLPFIGSIISNPVGDLNRLKVDISVITDRLETSVKLAGEEYISKLHHVLSEELDLASWRESIARKMGIIQEICGIYQHDLEVTRQDLLTCSIIVLILLELLIGMLNAFRH